ncbi:MAG: lipocalin family protein [Flavobacteriales bacterium]|jgi:hypothetical protein|nr:lipocalin family protein [Flavobacteriales bacterium]
MKKLLFSTFVIILTLVSCSKDISDDIVDTWFLKSIAVDELTINANECMKKTNFTFNDNGAFQSVFYDDDFGDDECESDSESGNWSVDDDSEKLTLTINGEAIVYAISIEDDELTMTLSGSQVDAAQKIVLERK